MATKSTRSETDQTITDHGRGAAERIVLGNNPYGSVLRMILAVAAFIVLFGSVYFFASR